MTSSLFKKVSILLFVLLFGALALPAAAAENVTTIEKTVIDSGEQAYVQFEIWLVLFVLTFLFFFHSWIFIRNTDITAVLAFVFSGLTAALSGYIEFHSVQVVAMTDGIAIVPISYIAHPPWLQYIMIGMSFIAILNMWRVAKDLYFPGRQQRRG
jgi:hypothetical protein